MDIIKSLDSLQLNDDFVVADEIRQVCRRKNDTIVRGMKSWFSQKGYTLLREFNGKSILVDLFYKTRSKNTMHLHDGSNYLEALFWIPYFLPKLSHT